MAQEIESQIDAEAVGRQLDRILSSKVFSTAKRSRMFLRYAVERSLASSVRKEFEIAVDVLGRSADYDPDVDATVRVEAGLRVTACESTTTLQERPIRFSSIFPKARMEPSSSFAK